MKSMTRRLMLAAALIASVAGVVAYTANMPGSHDSDPWSALRLSGAMEVEHYSDPLAMRDAADAVVVGKFTSFSPGRSAVIPNGLGPGQNDQLFWVNGTLSVEEVIRGTGFSAGQPVTVEFFVGGIEEAPFMADNVARLQGGLGDTIGRAVLFLRRSGGATDPGRLNPCQTWPAEDLAVYGMTPQNCDAQAIYTSLGLNGTSKTAVDAAGGLRLVWSYGLVASTKDAPVDVPLGEKPEENQAAKQLSANVQDWTSLDEFIAYLRG